MGPRPEPARFFSFFFLPATQPKEPSRWGSRRDVIHVQVVSAEVVQRCSTPGVYSSFVQPRGPNPTGSEDFRQAIFSFEAIFTTVAGHQM